MTRNISVKFGSLDFPWTRGCRAHSKSPPPPPTHTYTYPPKHTSNQPPTNTITGVAFVKGYAVPVLVLGGGGYTLRNVPRCWAYETSVLLDTDIKDDLPFHDYFEYYGACGASVCRCCAVRCGGLVDGGGGSLWMAVRACAMVCSALLCCAGVLSWGWW